MERKGRVIERRAGNTFAGGIALRDGLPWRSRCGGWAIFLMAWIRIRFGQLAWISRGRGIERVYRLASAFTGPRLERPHRRTGEAWLVRIPSPLLAIHTQYVHRSRSRGRPEKAMHSSIAQLGFCNRAQSSTAKLAPQASRPMCLK